MSNRKIYINGTIHDEPDARISVFDHGLLYGDGVFEGIRIYGGLIFKLKEHIDRLYESARGIALTIPMEPDHLMRAVRDTVQANNKTDGYIRLIVTRGAGDLGLNPDNCKQATVIIIVGDIALYPKECYEKGIAVITASTRRLGRDMLDPRIKSMNYLNNILAKIEAKQAGCMEAVMLNREGYIAECTGDNIFMVHQGILLTPHPSMGLLKGITRDTVMELAAARDFPCRETALTPYDLYRADECFVTGSGAELMPVAAADGRPIGNGVPGPLTAALSAAFRDFIREIVDARGESGLLTAAG